MTHWLPYIGLWAFIAVFVAVFAFYVYAALPLFRPTPDVRRPTPAPHAGEDDFAVGNEVRRVPLRH